MVFTVAFQEKLEAIGRGIPERAAKKASSQDNEAILQMLLSSTKDMVRLSWIAWLADQHPAIEDNLRNLVLNLETALTAYRGEFLKPAQQLLAYAHQMQGKIAFDRLDYAAAGGHFSEMIQLGQELNDADIIAVGMAHQGDVLRKRGRYEQAFRCFEATQPFASASSLNVKGMLYTLSARGYYLYGDENKFTEFIYRALDVAAQTKEDIENLANYFTLEAVLEEQAAGFTTLWKPEKALKIYEETDKLRIFRPLREQGSYVIDKAQAYLHLGDVKTGTELAQQGIQLATEYRSKRHIARLSTTYDRLKVSHIGKDKRLNILKDALIASRQAQEEW
jgi:tetratricopeptide (TPR) repeat protein